MHGPSLMPLHEKNEKMRNNYIVNAKLILLFLLINMYAIPRCIIVNAAIYIYYYIYLYCYYHISCIFYKELIVDLLCRCRTLVHINTKTLVLFLLEKSII